MKERNNAYEFGQVHFFEAVASLFLLVALAALLCGCASEQGNESVPETSSKELSAEERLALERAAAKGPLEEETSDDSLFTQELYFPTFHFRLPENWKAQLENGRGFGTFYQGKEGELYIHEYRASEVGIGVEAVEKVKEACEKSFKTNNAEAKDAMKNASEDGDVDFASAFHDDVEIKWEVLNVNGIDFNYCESPFPEEHKVGFFALSNPSGEPSYVEFVVYQNDESYATNPGFINDFINTFSGN